MSHWNACMWLAVSKIKKHHDTWQTQQNAAEHSDSRNVAGQVRTDVTAIPAQVRNINATSSSRVQRYGHQFHDVKRNIISYDEVAAASHTESGAGDWTPSSLMSTLTLSFQLKGDVVELRLTRSKSQTSYTKVFVAERGRVRRWIPTYPNDVSWLTSYFAASSVNILEINATRFLKRLEMIVEVCVQTGPEKCTKFDVPSFCSRSL